MRVAIVADIHGNLTALEAVLADLRETAPDLIVHGGDLAHGGARPAEALDCVIDQGWTGVLGNTDEMLFNPSALEQFAQQSNPSLAPMFEAIGEMAFFTRAALGPSRIDRLRDLPPSFNQPSLGLIHASPGDLWRAPGPEASDVELERIYQPLGRLGLVYCHIHHAFVRKVGNMTVANTGSVGLPFDGDCRASYLLLDETGPLIRRVPYDLERELKAVSESELPHADWVMRTLRTARPQMP